MKKLNLKKLKIESFVTDFQMKNQKTVKGGACILTVMNLCDPSAPENCESGIDTCPTGHNYCTPTFGNTCAKDCL